MEKADTEFLLERADLGAEGWLGDVEFLGGAAEVEFLGDGGKVFQMSEFHGIDINKVSMGQQTCIGQNQWQPQ